MPDTTPTEDDLNAMDITDAEAREMNRISHPLVAGADTDAVSDLVTIELSLIHISEPTRPY